LSEESTLLGQFTNSLVRKLAQQRCWKKGPFPDRAPNIDAILPVITSPNLLVCEVIV
jgi:hypothetical protein